MSGVGKFGDPTSAWWFYGTLRPITATRFNVQQVRVRRGAWLEIFHDSIAMWSIPGVDPISGPEEPREMFGLVLGAYAFLTGVALDWKLDGWVEAKNANLTESVLGIVVDRRGHDAHLSTRSKRSVAMRRAAGLAVAVHRVPGYRLALRDMYSAFNDSGDDAFVFAHRAVEDVARGVSGLSGYFGPADWQCLHARLGVAEPDFAARVKPLKDARDAVSHPRPDDPALIAARADRAHTLDISRWVVAEAFAAERDLTFELRWLRTGPI